MSNFQKTVISLRVTKEQKAELEELAQMASEIEGTTITKTHVILKTYKLGKPRYLQILGIPHLRVKKLQKRKSK